MARTRFTEVNKLPGTINVPMNTVRFMEFDTLKKGLVTEGLNSSSAVVIVSEHAAILANIAPSMTGSDGDQNAKAKMHQLEALFAEYQHMFSQGPAWLVYAVMNDQEALPSQREIIEGKLSGQLGLSVKQVPYQVVPGSYRTPDLGTVVIDARNGTPEVYIDGKREG